MLVLSRQLYETIVITAPPSTAPQTISVSVVAIRGEKCRLGFDCDPRVTIHRKEIADVIAAEKRRIDSQAEPGIGEDFG